MKALRLAIVGCGKRTRTVYGCFLKTLAAELEVVAVCDPVCAAADTMAAFYRARPFYSIRDLVAARPMEAVLLVTPEESHHALSVFLSRHGLPHACETPLAPTLTQARDMVAEAGKAGVVLHLNEQFFRRDVVAFSRQIVASGAIGRIGRALIHGGHGGTHDNAVLMAYAGGQPPVAVNAIQHVMPVARHKELYNRWFEEERFLLRAIHVACLRVDLPGGAMTYRNPTLDYGIANTYLSSVALATLDFVHAVRGEAPQEFGPSHALAAAEIETGFELSAERNGARVELPLPATLPADARCLEALRKKHGVDPMDVEAMIERAFTSTQQG